MSKAAARTVRLTDRDHAILGHVHRYRLTTIEVLRRLFWEPGCTPNAVSQVLARLAAFLHEAPLIGPQKIYLLTAAAAREYGEDEDFASPPGPTSLAHHLAMLEYCCLADERREHITAREIREGFPGFDGRGIARNRYFHTEGEHPWLGWLEVDCGSNAEARVRKCHKQFAKRYNAEGLKFRELADAGRFGIVLITTSDGKRRALERALRKLDPFPLEVRTSETLRLLLGRGDAAARASPDDGSDDAG